MTGTVTRADAAPNEVGLPDTLDHYLSARGRLFLSARSDGEARGLKDWLLEFEAQDRRFAEALETFLALYAPLVKGEGAGKSALACLACRSAIAEARSVSAWLGRNEPPALVRLHRDNALRDAVAAHARFYAAWTDRLTPLEGALGAWADIRTPVSAGGSEVVDAAEIITPLARSVSAVAELLHVGTERWVGFASVLSE